MSAPPIARRARNLADFLRRTRPLVVLTAPIIYSLILPLVLLDLFVTLYQAVCFRVYGIAPVRRRDHVAIDRHHLAYLNALQQLNCVYCGYGNGVLSYAREIAARTEAYWCPIKHARRVADPHDLMAGFADYGDGRGGFSGGRPPGNVPGCRRTRGGKRPTRPVACAAPVNFIPGSPSCSDGPAHA